MFVWKCSVKMVMCLIIEVSLNHSRSSWLLSGDVIVAFQKAERELQYLTLCANDFYTIVMGWAFSYQIFSICALAKSSINAVFFLLSGMFSAAYYTGSLFWFRHGNGSALQCLFGCARAVGCMLRSC